MERISVLEIFRTFTKSELKKFSDFTHSPFFNKNSNVIKLYDIISKFAPKYDEEKLTKEFIWTQLYPGKNYNYGIISNLISELNKLALRYLAIEHFEDISLIPDTHLIASLSQRGITNYASSKIHEVERNFLDRDLSRTGLNHMLFHQFMNIISDEKINLIHSLEGKFNEKTIHKIWEEKTIYIANHLLHSVFLIYDIFKGFSVPPKNSFAKFFMEIFDDATVSKIIERLKETSPIDYLILKTFYLPVSSQRNGATEKEYHEYKELIYSIMDLLNRDMVRDLIYGLNNLATAVYRNKGFRRININEEHQIILKIIIDRELHINEYGEADPNPLRACCIYGIALMDIETIRMVLNKYSNKVGKQLRKYFVNLCELSITLCEEDYKKALSLISTFTPIDQQEKIRIKCYKAICLYELNYYDLFLLEKDSFEKFSDYHENLEEHILRLKKYYKYIGTLFRLREKFDITNFRKLYKEVISNKSSHQWLKNTLIKMKDEHGVKMKLLEIETDSFKKTSTGTNSSDTVYF